MSKKNGMINTVIGGIAVAALGAGYMIYKGSKFLFTGGSSKTPKVKLTEGSGKTPKVKLTEAQKHDQFIMDALYKKYGVEFVTVGEGKYPNNHRYLKVSPVDYPELVITAGAGKSFKTSGPVVDFSDYGYRLTDDFFAIGGANYTKILKEHYSNISFDVGGTGICFSVATIEDIRESYQLIKEIDPVRDNIIPFTLLKSDFDVSLAGEYSQGRLRLEVAQRVPWYFFHNASEYCFKRIKKEEVDESTIPLNFLEYFSDIKRPTVLVLYNDYANRNAGIITMCDITGKVCIPHERLFELLVSLNRDYNIKNFDLRVDGHANIIRMFNYFGYYQIYDTDGNSYGSPTHRCKYTWQLDGNKFAMDDNIMGVYQKNGEEITLPMVTISHDNCDEITTAYYLEDIMKMLGDNFTYENLDYEKIIK